MFKRIFVTILFLAQSSFCQTLEGKVVVTDGDTINLSGYKVRLDGIDALESSQYCENAYGVPYRCGLAATKFLQTLINNSDVRCEGKGTDRYERILATCFVNQINLNEEMVREGMAVAYRQYSSRYIEQEEAASSNNVGVWSGKFVYPWEWRKGKRLSDTKTKICNIKGNISSSGKIYHTADSKWYHRTKIDETKGERWFCTVEDAIEAGWRPPK